MERTDHLADVYHISVYTSWRTQRRFHRECVLAAYWLKGRESSNSIGRWGEIGNSYRYISSYHHV